MKKYQKVSSLKEATKFKALSEAYDYLQENRTDIKKVLNLPVACEDKEQFFLYDFGTQDFLSIEK